MSLVYDTTKNTTIELINVGDGLMYIDPTTQKKNILVKLNDTAYYNISTGKTEILVELSKSGGSNIIYAPVLDGTEAITTISGQQSPIITNNIFTGQNSVGNGGCGFLSEGWDNTILWELNCKVMWGPNGNNGFCIYDGISTGRDRGSVKITECEFWKYDDAGNANRIIGFSNKVSVWCDVKVTKKSSTELDILITYNGDTKLSRSIEWSVLPNHDKVFVGIDSWDKGSTRYNSIKDIVVTKI